MSGSTASQKTALSITWTATNLILLSLLGVRTAFASNLQDTGAPRQIKTTVDSVSTSDNAAAFSSQQTTQICSKFRRLSRVFDKTRMCETENTDSDPNELIIAREFCHIVLGKTTSQISQLVSRPLVLSGDALGRNADVAPANQWIYLIGKSAIIVRLNFEHGVCSDARANSYKTDPWYWDWRLSELSKFAFGKTLPEIISREGFPVDITPVNPSLGIPKNDQLQFWKHYYLAAGVLTYRLGGCTYLELKISKNRCVGMERHVRTGWSDIPMATFLFPKK